MITREDLQEAIAECQGRRHPDAATCIKLAAYLTIQRELYGETPEIPVIPERSYSPAPEQAGEKMIQYDSGSEFSGAIYGRDPNEVWAIMDELMQTLQAVYPRLYNSVMRSLDD